MRDSKLDGAPEEIRTPDPQIRSYVLAIFLSLWPQRKRSGLAANVPYFKGISMDTP
jgi:hypothetical protein